MHRYVITNGKKMGVYHMVDVYCGVTHIAHYNVKTIKEAKALVKLLKR